MAAVVEPQLAQMHWRDRAPELISGFRAVCRDHGDDNGVPNWMSDDLHTDGPAYFNALIDAKVHNLEIHR